MEVNTVKAIIGIGLLVLLFLALQFPLKDRKMLERFSFINADVIRIHLILMLSFQAGQVVDPRHFETYVTLFDLSVFTMAGYLYWRVTSTAERV